jgi:drug/metabolite transporter (DMT)-like permease
VCTVVVAASTGAGRPGGADYAWAVLAGVGSGIGSGFLYRGFAAGRMSVVAPVSAVGAALVPVAAGVVTGERPTSLVWLGVVAALPGIWLVSSTPDDPLDAEHPANRGSFADGATDGVLAGLGFGLLFACVGQIPDTSGLWPLALTQLVSVPAVVALALLLRAAWLPRDRVARWALLCGPLGTGAVLAFLLATQHGFLTVAGVLASLYPASTVLLAALVLKERVHAAQAVGLVLCGLAVGLVAAG